MNFLSRIFKDERTLQAVLCVTADEFNSLVAGFERAWLRSLHRPGRLRAPGAGRKAVLDTPEQKLAFILFYLKVYPTFDLMGVFAGLDRSECCRWVCPCLRKSSVSAKSFPNAKSAVWRSFTPPSRKRARCFSTAPNGPSNARKSQAKTAKRIPARRSGAHARPL